MQQSTERRGCVCVRPCYQGRNDACCFEREFVTSTDPLFAKKKQAVEARIRMIESIVVLLVAL